MTAHAKVASGADRLRDINEHYTKFPLYVREIVNNWHVIRTFFREKCYFVHTNTRLGWLWYILDPLFQLFIWMFVFQFVFDIKTEHYSVFLFSGITAWGFINSSWLQGMASLRSKRSFYLENNVPRITSVISCVLSAAFFFGIQTLILFVMIPINGVKLTPYMLYIPCILLFMSGMALGGALVLSIFDVYMSDIRNFTGHFMRLLFYLSPIVYPISRIPKEYRWIFGLNPFCGIFESYKNILLYGKPPDWGLLVPTTIFIVVTISFGAWLFFKNEPTITRYL